MRMTAADLANTIMPTLRLLMYLNATITLRDVSSSVCDTCHYVLLQSSSERSATTLSPTRLHICHRITGTFPGSWPINRPRRTFSFDLYTALWACTMNPFLALLTGTSTAYSHTSHQYSFCRASWVMKETFSRASSEEPINISAHISTVNLGRY